MDTLEIQSSHHQTPEAMPVWRATLIGVLSLAAIFKICGLIHPSSLLFQNDPIFKVPILYVVAGASLMECFLCIHVWFTSNSATVAWAVFAFAVAILTYRSLALANGVSYCPCLGNVNDWWPWLGRHESPILTSVAIWLFLTSALQLMRGWKSA